MRSRDDDLHVTKNSHEQASNAIVNNNTFLLAFDKKTLDVEGVVCPSYSLFSCLEHTMSTSDPSSTTAAAQSSSILSDKVQRALQVRVDTAAMRTALEALGQLQDLDHFHHLDARTVRHAMEYDALQQALLLQKELVSLRDQTRALREGLQTTTELAHAVKEAIYTNVMNAPQGSTGTTSMLTSTTLPSNETSTTESTTVAAPPTPTTNDDDDDKAEEDLAASLAEAFSRRDMAQQRLQAVQQFLETFDLSEEDSQLLDQYNFEDMVVGAVVLPSRGRAFLQALERVRDIRQALTQSLGRHEAERGLGASSALRMMEGLAQKQERAYERLYHWLQVHLQLFGKGRAHEESALLDEDDESMDHALQHPFVQRALYTLRHVEAFYRHTLELIAGRRRQDETRRFLLALTAGYAGAPPMERLAHDAVAYTGDMLAFCFRSFSAEADVARTLVHYQPDDESVDADVHEEKDEGAATDKKEEKDYAAEQPLSASAFLSTSMSGMARPLKSRILQVVASLARRPDENDAESDDGMIDDFDEEGAVVRHKITQIYDICGLVLFYISAMEKTVAKLKVVDEEAGLSTEENDALIEQLVNCLEEAARAFEATVRVYCAMLSQLSSQTGESESSLGHALVVMIAEVRLTSPGFAQDVKCPPSCEKQLSVEWATATVTEAAMASCQVLDDTIALKRTVEAARKAGLPAIAAEKLEEEIEKTEGQLVASLIEVETAKVLDLCGLGPLASAWLRWKDSPDRGEMAVSPGLSLEEVEASMKDFYSSLFSPPLPSLEASVKDPSMRRTARSKIASNICETYAGLYEDLQTGGYEDLSVLGHTPAQVKTLFSA